MTTTRTEWPKEIAEAALRAAGVSPGMAEAVLKAAREYAEAQAQGVELWRFEEPRRWAVQTAEAALGAARLDCDQAEAWPLVRAIACAVMDDARADSDWTPHVGPERAR